MVPEVAAEIGVTGNQLVAAWMLHQVDPAPMTLSAHGTREQYDISMGALPIRLQTDILAALDGAGA